MPFVLYAVLAALLGFLVDAATDPPTVITAIVATSFGAPVANHVRLRREGD